MIPFATHLRRIAAAALVVGSSACSQLPTSGDDAGVLDEALRTHRVVLLGEVHDSVAQHALRAAALRRLVAGGARPAILMEQFDREHQPALDAVLDEPGVTPERVIAAASPGDPARSGWDWRLYRPYLALAIEYRLPLVAANVSRADVRRVIAEGLEADGFDPAVPDDIRAVQAQAIVDGHCGLLDREKAEPLVGAQVARDQFMAHAIEVNAGRGAVLLAGNGHVRRDVGVPRWLEPTTRRDAVSIGLLEVGQPAAPGEFDRVLRTAATPRPDPCAALRR